MGGSSAHHVPEPTVCLRHTKPPHIKPLVLNRSSSLQTLLRYHPFALSISIDCLAGCWWMVPQMGNDVLSHIHQDHVYTMCQCTMFYILYNLYVDIDWVSSSTLAADARPDHPHRNRHHHRWFASAAAAAAACNHQHWHEKKPVKRVEILFWIEHTRETMHCAGAVRAYAWARRSVRKTWTSEWGWRSS